MFFLSFFCCFFMLFFPASLGHYKGLYIVYIYLYLRKIKCINSRMQILADLQ